MADQTLLDEADKQYRAGRYDEAIRTYESARDLRHDAAYQAFIDLNVAQSLRRQGHANEAKLLAQRGLDRLKPSQAMPTKAELLITLGNVEGDLGAHQQALDFFDQAQREFIKLRNNHGIYQALIGKSRSFAQAGQDDEARKALRSVLSSHDAPAIVRSQALTNLAVIESSENPRVARELLNEDLELHGHLNDDYGLAGTLINLAHLEVREGDSSKAKVLLDSAREAATRANASDLLARALTMLQDIR